VRSGLGAGDRVITAGFARLAEGAHVSVAAVEEPTSGPAPELHQGGGAPPPGAEGVRRGGGGAGGGGRERRRREGADAGGAAPANVAPGATASSTQ
jgi:hypothetical protein